MEEILNPLGSIIIFAQNVVQNIIILFGIDYKEYQEERKLVAKINRNIYILLILLIIMENKTKEIKCNHCGYEWNTASEKIYVSCPSCLKKVKQEIEEKCHIKLNKGGNKK